MTLYELTTTFNDFLGAVESGDVPEEAIADTLEAIEADIDTKIDNTACLIKQLEAEEAAVEAEEKRLVQRRKAKAAARERITAYLGDMLSALGKDRFENARVSISFRKTPAKVVVADEPGFIRWAMENDDSLISYGRPTLNKTAIKAAIENGRALDGVEIATGRKMQIK